MLAKKFTTKKKSRSKKVKREQRMKAKDSGECVLCVVLRKKVKREQKIENKRQWRVCWQESFQSAANKSASSVYNQIAAQ